MFLVPLDFEHFANILFVELCYRMFLMRVDPMYFYFFSNILFIVLHIQRVRFFDLVLMKPQVTKHQGSILIPSGFFSTPVGRHGRIPSFCSSLRNVSTPPGHQIVPSADYTVLLSKPVCKSVEGC